MVAVAIVLAFVLYGLFFAGNGDSGLVSTTSDGDVDPAGAELLAALFSLRSITLDVSLFETPDFKSLVDFSQEIPSEPVGRANPFAPIGVDDGDADNNGPDGEQATST